MRSIQVQPDFDNLRIRVVSLHSIARLTLDAEFGDMSRNLQPRPFMFKATSAKTKATNVVQKLCVMHLHKCKARHHELIQ